MRARLILPDDDAWGAVLDRLPHDFYHLPAYVELCARVEAGSPRALLVEGGESVLLQPLLLRALPDGLPATGARFDATSPYGYPGPIFSGDDDFVRRAVDVSSSHLAAEGVAAMFVRLHPLLNAGFESTGCAGVLEGHGETVVVDLHQSDEEHWRQTRSGHRNEINKAQRTGQVARMDPTWEHGAEFARIYRQTMRRVGASSYYMFDDAYFEGLRSALGDRLHLCVVEIDGELAAGGLFSEVSGIVQYHLSGTDARFVRERPNKLMLHFVRAWAKQRGNRWLHLGGGVGGVEDSLFRFKSGFSDGRRPFHTWRLVPLTDVYRALVTSRHGEAGRLDGRGFFPDYRRPAEA